MTFPILSYKALTGTDVSSFFKKGSHSDKSNYLQVGILPSHSKFYEHLIYSQLNEVTKNT